MTWVYHPGSRIQILPFYPSWIPDPGLCDLNLWRKDLKVIIQTVTRAGLEMNVSRVDHKGFFS
jgi:hypothetical protein